VTVQANFPYQASFGSKGPVAYETLLLDSMRGDATLFTRRDEVEAEWRIITPIEEAWAQLPAPDFPNYAAGSAGTETRNDDRAKRSRKGLPADVLSPLVSNVCCLETGTLLRACPGRQGPDL